MTWERSAVVDRNVDKHGICKVAEACLQFLYIDEGQKIIAEHYYRPPTEKEATNHAAQFPKVKLFTLADIAGN